MADKGAGSWKMPARLAGLFLTALFAGLSGAGAGFRIDVFPDFSVISQGELMLWIGHALLLLPGAVLLGAGFSGPICRLVNWCLARLAALNSARLTIAWIVLFLVGACAAWLGNTLAFRGFPVTDDEYAVKFGGQVLASGAISVPEPVFAEALPARYFFSRDGMMTSMDWLGPQVVWAVSELTGTGNLVWAILAGIGLAATAAAAGRLLGRVWALPAALFFGFSPMAATLSMSTHAHLASRTFFAVALLMLIEAIRREGDWRIWSGFGLFVAVSFVCRPFETGFLALPIGIDLAWRAVRRKPGSAVALGAVLAGAALPVLVFALHSWALTGNPLVPPRFAVGASIPESLPVSSTWGRFGNGVAFNALMLGVWFLGPLGVALAAFGGWTNRVTKLLSAGIVSVLGLGLLHDNFGIHTVGPIHYSECAVPLTVIATQGLFNVRTWLERRSIDFRPLVGAVSMAVILGMGVFNAVTLAGIRRQAEIQGAVYERLELLGRSFGRKVIVLAPQFAAVWRNDEKFASTGSWVFDWRRPRPDYEDQVLILHSAPDVTAQLRHSFPDRTILRLELPPSGSEFTLVPVIDAAPSSSP